MLTRIWKILFSGLLAISLVMGVSLSNQAKAQSGVASYLVTPDYFGQKIIINQLSREFTPGVYTTGRPGTYSVRTPNCNPNSVIQHESKLYVACNRGSNPEDFIGVYSFEELAIVRPRNMEFPFEKTIKSKEFNSIVAIKFDRESNLWVSSYNNNQIVRFPKASLDTNDPKPDRKLINSPDKPAGIAFDKNGSLWVVGEDIDRNGIVINIPTSELNKLGNIVGGITVIDATPSYCISNHTDGCQQKPDLFDGPEGIAILNNDDIWISNNGGNHPAASLVRLRPAQNQIDRFGNGVAKPFSCPGGLDTDNFVDPPALWVNDQSFSLTNTSCGASDQKSGTGKVLFYGLSDLSSPATLNSNPLGIQNITSRPGFGGIDAFTTGISFSRE
jgi:hypothetical protein